MVRIVWLSFLATFDYVTTGYFFVEKIELNVIAAGFGIFSSNEFYSSNGKALGWLVFFQLDLERGGSNDVATTDDVCSISRKVKLILWLFAIKWHLHSSEHRRLLVLSQFSLLTLWPVDRSSSLVFNVRPGLYTTMIRTYVLKHRQFASCLYYYLQTSTLLEEYWCAAVCVCLYRSKVYRAVYSPFQVVISLWKTCTRTSNHRIYISYTAERTPFTIYMCKHPPE